MTDDPVAHLTAALDAAQRDAEAANGRHWINAEGDDAHTAWVMNEDMHLFETDPATARHVANNSPQAVLRRIAADRKLIADLLAEKHQACEDSWYNCSAADEYGKRNGNQECDCGRDARVERRARLLAEGWGWTDEAT